jgi:hypothetical protein
MSCGGGSAISNVVNHKYNNNDSIVKIAVMMPFLLSILFTIGSDAIILFVVS